MRRALRSAIGIVRAARDLERDDDTPPAATAPEVPTYSLPRDPPYRAFGLEQRAARRGRWRWPPGEDV